MELSLAALVRGSADERSSFFDGSAYLVAPVDAWQQTDFGRPQAVSVASASKIPR